MFNNGWYYHPDNNHYGIGIGMTSAWSFPKPPVKWIMTDDQLNRLNALAREIALENGLILMTSTDKESFGVTLIEKADEDDDNDTQTQED